MFTDCSEVARPLNVIDREEKKAIESPVMTPNRNEDDNQQDEDIGISPLLICHFAVIMKDLNCKKK